MCALLIHLMNQVGLFEIRPVGSLAFLQACSFGPVPFFLGQAAPYFRAMPLGGLIEYWSLQAARLVSRKGLLGLPLGLDLEILLVRGMFAAQALAAGKGVRSCFWS